ncbi:hypothetical protein ABKN59_011107 [Abortiporus biennis]
MYSDQRRNGETGTANTMRLCRVHGSELLLPQASVIVDNLGLSRGHSYVFYLARMQGSISSYWLFSVLRQHPLYQVVIESKTMSWHVSKQRLRRLEARDVFMSLTGQVIVILVVRRHPRIHESYVSQTDSAGITNTKDHSQRQGSKLF